MVRQKTQMPSKAELFVVQKSGSVEKKEMDLNFPCKVKGKLYIVTSQDCVPYLLPKSETQQDKHIDPRDAEGFQYGMSSKVCGAVLDSEVRLLLSPSEIHRLNSSFNIIGFYKALTNCKEDLESLFNTQATKKRKPLVPDKLIKLASQFLCSSDAKQIRRFSEKLKQRFTDKVTEQCLNVGDRAKALVFGVLLTLVAAEEGTFINSSGNIPDKINIPGDSDDKEQFEQMVTAFQMEAKLLTVSHQERNVFILFRNPTPETWVTGGVTDLDHGTQLTYGLCNKLFSVSGPGWEVQFLQNLQESYNMTCIFHLSGFAHHLLMDPRWRENLASLQKKASRAEAIRKLCALAVRFLHDEKYRHTFTKHFQEEIGEKCSDEVPLDGCGEILLGMLVAVKAALIARDINDGKISVCDEPVGVHSTQQQTVKPSEEKKPSEKMTPPGVKQADHAGVQDITDTAEAKEVTSTEPKADDPPTEPKADDPPTEPKADDRPPEPKADDPPTEPKADDPPTEPKADDPPTEPKADDRPPEPKADDRPPEPKADDRPPEPKADDRPPEPKADDRPPEPKADDPPPKADDPPPKPKADDHPPKPKADDPPPKTKADETSAEPRDDPSEPKLHELPPEANSAPNVEDASPTPDVDKVFSGPHLDDHSHGPKTVNATSAPKNIDPAPVPDDASPPVEANEDELKRNTAVPRGNEDTARVTVDDSTPIVEDASAPGDCSAAVPIAGDVGVKERAQRIPLSSQASSVETEDSADRKDVIREHPENAVNTSSGGLSGRQATAPLGRGSILGFFIAVVLLYFFIDSLSGILPKSLQILLSSCIALVVAIFVFSTDWWSVLKVGNPSNHRCKSDKALMSTMEQSSCLAVNIITVILLENEKSP